MRNANVTSPPAAQAVWCRFAALALMLMIAATMTITGVLLHEGAHLLAGIAFGFAGPQLSFDSSTFTDDEAVLALVRQDDMAAVAGDYHPLWQLALVSAAGPLILLAAGVLCLRFARRNGLIAVAGIALLLIQVPTSLGVLLAPPARQFVNIDEVGVATFGGLPVMLVAGIESTALLVTMVALARSVPRGQRLATWLTAAAGSVIGLYVWLAWLGPMLLP